MTTTTRRTRPPLAPQLDDLDETLEPDEGDLLAREPLTADEIRALEAQPNDVSEQDEGALDALRKATEVKLPFDPDDGDATVAAADMQLGVRTRPKHKRR